MLLEFTKKLVRVGKYDLESCQLADRHYSRQKPGTNQFMPPGKTIVLRSARGDVVFGWLWQEKRDDGQTGYCCSIFRNESPRLSSEIILEAERFAVAAWGNHRGFTYVSPHNVRPKRNPGWCFMQAGWRLAKITATGLHLLEKNILGSRFAVAPPMPERD
jgi:hypothetical protein